MVFKAERKTVPPEEAFQIANIYLRASEWFNEFELFTGNWRPGDIWISKEIEEVRLRGLEYAAYMKSGGVPAPRQRSASVPLAFCLTCITKLEG
jgi:hypothetical protein